MAVKTWIGWGLAIAGALVAGPLVLGRGRPELRPAQAEISRMSEVERAALKRKYNQYLSLSEAERADLRALHQQLEADQTDKAMSLATMADYCNWLKTIDPWQQDDLAHISDPQLKTLRVVEIVAERKEAELDAETASDDRLPPGNGRLQLPSLTETQLTRLFDVLAKRLTDLSEDEKKQLESLHGLRRIGFQIHHLKKSAPKPDQLFQSIKDAELREMAEASGNAEWQAILTNLSDPVLRKKSITQGIFAACRNQFTRESALISDEELRKFLQTLERDDQDDLLQLRADEFKTILQLRCLEADPHISEFGSVMGYSAAKRRMQRFRREGGRPIENGGPPFGRSGGLGDDGPPPGERREGDRGGVFRPGNGRRPFGEGPPGRPGGDGGPSAGSVDSDRPSPKGDPPRIGEEEPPQRPD